MRSAARLLLPILTCTAAIAFAATPGCSSTPTESQPPYGSDWPDEVTSICSLLAPTDSRLFVHFRQGTSIAEMQRVGDQFGAEFDFTIADTTSALYLTPEGADIDSFATAIRGAGIESVLFAEQGQAREPISEASEFYILSNEIMLVGFKMDVPESDMDSIAAAADLLPFSEPLWPTFAKNFFDSRADLDFAFRMYLIDRSIVPRCIYGRCAGLGIFHVHHDVIGYAITPAYLYRPY